MELNIPVSELALGWLLHDKRVTSIIVGNRNIEQLNKNLTVADKDMPDDLWRRLESASDFEPGYPHLWFESIKEQILRKDIEHTDCLPLDEEI